MKNIFKKSLAFLLTLSMLSTLPMVAFATEEESEKTLKTIYNFSEAFEVADGYNFSAADAYYNLTLKNANSETSASPWKVGEFNLTSGSFEYNLTHLTRQWSTYGQAPEDSVSKSGKTHLIFSNDIQGSAGSEDGTTASTYRFKRSDGHSYIGYSFGQINNSQTYYNSHPGSKGSYRGAVRFVVPRDGVISPTAVFYDATDYANSGYETSVYATDGVLFKIYKQSGDNKTIVYGGEVTSPSDNSTGWARIPGAQYSTYKDAYLPVKAEDEVVMVFDAGNNTFSEEFEIVSYKIEYVDPIAPYDTDTYLSYQGGKINTVDLTRTPVIDGLDGTISYSLTDTQGLLTATSTPGFYTLTGATNYDGTTKGTAAVLKASYTPTGATEPSCETSTNIYISTPKNSYDMGEGFAIVDEYDFSTNGQEKNTVYQNLVPYLKYENSESSTSPWKYGRYELNNSNTFTYPGYLSVGWYTEGRAPEDETTSQSWPTRLCFGTGSTYKGPSGGFYGYQISGMMIGYAFGNNTSYNSFSGNTGSKYRNAVRFVVPKSGVVSPTVKLFDDNTADFSGNNDGVLFKLYKKNSAGTISLIYGGNFESPMDSSTGWERIPYGKVVTTWEGAKVSVAQGDELVLVFDPNSATSSDEFGIYSYTIDYKNPLEDYSADTYGYYEEGGKNLLDLTLDKTVATDNGTVTYTVMDSTGALTATETPGVYKMTGVLNYADYTKGTPITVVASYYAEGESAQNGDVPAYTSTTNLYIGEAVETYNIRDAYLPADGWSFTAGNAVADYNAITAKYENSETSPLPWKFGLVSIADGTFTYLPTMNRVGAYSRLIEDTVNSGWYAEAVYGKSLNTSKGTISGYYLGYGYEKTNHWNSFSGNYDSKLRSTIRFVVPRDGVINPVIKLMDDTTSFSGSTDGVLFKAYKKSGSVITAIYGGTITAPLDNSTGWVQIPAGTLTTWDTGKIGVKTGDEIILQFDPYSSTSSDEFGIHTVRMNYVDAIEPYDEITYATYDAESEDQTLNLTVTQYAAGGTVEYTKEDTINALKETGTPGVYTLAGVTNYDGVTLSTPVTVTASYYAEGESSANNNTPIVSITTTVYISSVLSKYEPFGHYTVKTTNLDMNYDAFFLPYYTNANERAVYGTIDLDLHERWAGATVTFDKSGYLEYVGDGHVKVLALYDHSKSSPSSVDSTDTMTTLSGSTLKARRDENTVGTPIKMTVTAPDGFSKSYYVLTFKAVVQDVEQDGHDVYRWIYGGYRGTTNRVNNAVMSFETVHGTSSAFTFKPMVPEPGGLDSGVLISLDIAGNKYVDARSGGKVDTYGARAISMMGSAYNTNNFGLDTGAVGIAQTFTAPKTGTLELTSFVPKLFTTWQSKFIGPAGQSGTLHINLYDEDDTLLNVIYTESWGPKEVDGSWDGPWQTYGNATYGDGVSGTRETGKLVFDVEKGQKVRVMIEYPDMTGFSSGQGAMDMQRAADPVFTYVESELDATIATVGESEITSSATATIPEIVDDATYTYFGYDANGKLVGSGYAALEEGATTLAPSVTGKTAVEYFKVFIWSDLTTLQSVGGALLLR